VSFVVGQRVSLDTTMRLLICGSVFRATENTRLSCALVYDPNRTILSKYLFFKIGIVDEF
jgi:hypothetical protein